MKRFTFRLDAYLRVCEYREQSERLKLAELQKTRERCAQLLHSLQKKLVQSQTEFSSRHEFLAYEGCQYVSHFRDLSRQIEKAGHELSEVDQKIRVQRDRITEARRRLRPVEKLREKRLRQYQHEATLTEQREADDIFLQRQARLIVKPDS